MKNDFSVPPTIINSFVIQKTSKVIVELNSTINELGLSDIYTLFYPTIAE